MPFVLRHGTSNPSSPTPKIEPAWQDFLDALPAMAWLADPTGRLLFANQAWRQATGRSPENFNAEQAATLVHPEDRHRLQGDPAFFSGFGTTFEFRLQQANGTYRWVSERITPWKNSSGELLGYFGCSIDIHEQKNNERRFTLIALRQTSLACFAQFVLEQNDTEAVNAEVLRLLCEHLALPAALLLLPGESENAPLRVAASRGLDPSEPLPKPIAKLGPDTLYTFPEGGKHFPLPAEWMEQAGWPHALGVPIDATHPERGCLIGLMLEEPVERPPLHYARDLAAIYSVAETRARAERRLHEGNERARQLQKMEAVGLLAGGVAHDFNNLLTAIRCFAEVLRDEVKEESQIARVDDILHATGRAAHLVRQLVSFSRHEVVQPEPVDLQALVDNLRAMIRSLLSEHIIIDFDLGESPAWCRADPKQIEQILFNLCLNARDAMPIEGRLTVSVSRLPAKDGGLGRVRLSVRDTGPGIPPEVQAKLFQPFFTTKPRGRGTGLGLATSRSIAQAYGGDLHYETASNQGTVFHLDLPEIADPLTDLLNSNIEAPTKSPRALRVLLVEDDELVRSVTAMLLENLGHRVTSFGESPAALTWAQNGGLESVDVLVTDVVMPELGGHALATRLQALKPELPVMFMSGYVDDPTILQLIEQPNIVFLAKPFAHEDFAARFRQVAERVSGARLAPPT